MITNEQVLDKINKKLFMSGDCWVWLGSVNKIGRPQITFDRRNKEEGKMLTFFPHEILYEQKYGELEVRYLDNTCGNLRCVNPDHQSPRTLERRLLSEIYIDDNQCWNWKGTFAPSGYGTITVEGKTKMVHRVSYEFHSGETIPTGMMVCHKCDNRGCINPSHLYIGTHNDNMRDMSDSDILKGEKNPKSILTQGQVMEIKQLIRERKVVYRKIAERYGVSRQAIKDIASGRTWGWLE